MKKIIYLITFILTFSIIGCESNIDSDNTNELQKSNSSFSGEWTVKAYINNNEIFGPFTIETQIAPNEDSVLIKDNKFWGFETKAATNNSQESFESKVSLNEICSVGSKIKILEGKVIGNDNISFNIQFEDDETPYGITYNIKGQRSK